MEPQEFLNNHLRGVAVAGKDAQKQPPINAIDPELTPQRTTTDRYIEAIAKGDSSLEQIDLGTHSSTITTQQLRQLTLALESNESVVTLGMKCLGISDKGAVQFSSLLRKNQTLTALDLGWNTIGSHGAQHLALALAHNSVLRELHIAGNTDIGDAGAGAIAQVLQHNNRALEVLDLSWTSMSTQGAHKLADALRATPDYGLRSVQLMGNAIGFDGVLAILESVQDKAMKFVGVAGNQVDDVRDDELIESIRSCRGLRKLDIRNNAIPLSRAAEISAALIQENSQLLKVQLCTEVTEESDVDDRTIGYLYL